MAKRIGIVPHLFARPLIEDLDVRRNGAGERLFDLQEAEYAQQALELRRGTLDGALLSPIEYARLNDPFERKKSEGSGDARFGIVTNAGVVSEGESGAVFLVFNEHLRNLRTVAVDPRFPAEIVLLKIVLGEKYDCNPQLLPSAKSVDAALATSDAALVVDRNALSLDEKHNKIDLVDEWLDVTEMPFIHGFWAAGENALSAPELESLSASPPPERLKDISPEEEGYLSNFSYTLDERAQAALNEFFRMAYYHGVLKDIPDVRLHGAGKK